MVLKVFGIKTCHRANWTHRSSHRPQYSFLEDEIHDLDTRPPNFLANIDLSPKTYREILKIAQQLGKIVNRNNILTQNIVHSEKINVPADHFLKARHYIFYIHNLSSRCQYINCLCMAIWAHL